MQRLSSQSTFTIDSLISPQASNPLRPQTGQSLPLPLFCNGLFIFPRNNYYAGHVPFPPLPCENLVSSPVPNTRPAQQQIPSSYVSSRTHFFNKEEDRSASKIWTLTAPISSVQSSSSKYHSNSRFSFILDCSESFYLILLWNASMHVTSCFRSWRCTKLVNITANFVHETFLR